ncbi:hypothetical protein ILYODFUR_029690 [Ilyodon furcidens]|uniref:Uncharacterized protein n=1 Tax=Ilyodon furcidens TaxID=33524 RepID=A0ABV0TPP6_9TELE
MAQVSACICPVFPCVAEILLDAPVFGISVVNLLLPWRFPEPFSLSKSVYAAGHSTNPTHQVVVPVITFLSVYTPHFSRSLSDPPVASRFLSVDSPPTLLPSCVFLGLNLLLPFTSV